MRIGIDISQLQYKQTGVANYLASLVKTLIETSPENHFVLFYAALRGKPPEVLSVFRRSQNVRIIAVPLPTRALDILWNRMHIVPIELFIGEVDIFLSSDWTQPPVRRAKSATIIYDLIVYKYPEETASRIVTTQKQRLKWVRRECSLIFCISKSTRDDVCDILDVPLERTEVLYPGVTI